MVASDLTMYVTAVEPSSFANVLGSAGDGNGFGKMALQTLA